MKTYWVMMIIWVLALICAVIVHADPGPTIYMAADGNVYSVPAAGLRIDQPESRVGGFTCAVRATSDTLYQLVGVEDGRTTIGGPVVRGQNDNPTLILKCNGEYWLWLYVTAPDGSQTRWSLKKARTIDILSLTLPPETDSSQGPSKVSPNLPTIWQLALKNNWNEGYVCMLEDELIRRNQSPNLVREAYEVVLKTVERDLRIYNQPFSSQHQPRDDGFVNQVVSCKMCHADNRNEPSPHGK